ncbi:unnamed protein product [Bemisia tabaci]|uniref:Abasic site processing protein HMCES n=2 Tax=Bemisia tabaci TaxID=7038 RepID=A0A9P0EYD2_BEMTA|nr:unnamed protein product [Bemisia tabaci]
MCGRTACNLCREDYQKATAYKDGGKYQKPVWNDVGNDGLTFKPSNNIAPTDVTPILLSGNHFDELSNHSRVLTPMVWGMIPPWHKGSFKSHGLSTNNCRIETLLSSKLYNAPLRSGKRCVVLCEGFYEWQTTKGKSNKQPYFIYMPQNDSVKVELRQNWTHANWNEEEGWTGPRLVHFAGLFNKWTAESGESVYSYTIITMESNKTLSWLHHRMPAILDTEQAVKDWLDFENVSTEEAMQILKPIQKLVWHPVSTIVNNSRNKDEECNKPLSTKSSSEKSKGATLMSNWLKRGQKKEDKEEKHDGSDGETPEKKKK